MQITLHLGLDQLPEVVRKQLERAGIINVGGTVVITNQGANGDEVTTIYSETSAQVLNPQPAPQPVPNKENIAPSNIQELRRMMKSETIWLTRELDAIKIDQDALNKMNGKDPYYTRRKEYLKHRKNEHSKRQAAQGKRRQMVKAAEGKAQTIEDSTVQKKGRKRSSRKQSRASSIASAISVKPVIQQRLPTVYEPVFQQRLPSLSNSLWNPTVNGPRPVNTSSGRKSVGSFDAVAARPLFEYNNAKPSFHAFRDPCLIDSPGPGTPVYQPPGAAPRFFTFSSPPRLLQNLPDRQQQRPALHPDRLANFGQSSRELQETAGFPLTPSYMEGLGQKRTGANIEPIAKRRSSPSKFRVAPFILHGFNPGSPSPLEGRTTENQQTDPKLPVLKKEFNQGASENRPCKKEVEEEPAFIMSEIPVHQDEYIMTGRDLAPADENLVASAKNNKPALTETSVKPYIESQERFVFGETITISEITLAEVNAPEGAPTYESRSIIGVQNIESKAAEADTVETERAEAKKAIESPSSAGSPQIFRKVVKLKDASNISGTGDVVLDNLFQVRELPDESCPMNE